MLNREPVPRGVGHEVARVIDIFHASKNFDIGRAGVRNHPSAPPTVLNFENGLLARFNE
jgi:hypothetical protein